MGKKALLSWSSGKDSAWALYTMKKYHHDIEVAGLFCTVNEKFGRVSMHGVRVELIRLQAESVGIPIRIIPIPYPCDNAEYESIMDAFIAMIKEQGIEYLIFGDLFLEDVRRYRQEKLARTGIGSIFPLWGKDTGTLSEEMINAGLRAKITCIDKRRLPSYFVGKEYDGSFLEELPPGVDPCGEKGEFHSFVFDGPIFKEPVEIQAGEIVYREDFIFIDLLAKGSS